MHILVQTDHCLSVFYENQKPSLQKIARFVTKNRFISTAGLIDFYILLDMFWTVL